MGKRELVHDFQIQARKLCVPVFQDLARTIESMDIVFHWRRDNRANTVQTELEQPPQLPAGTQDLIEGESGPLDEYSSKRIVGAYGIPTVAEAIASSPDECREIADSMGYPVVMKGLMPGLIHKTELGLVNLNVADTTSSRKVYKRLIKSMGGKGRVLLQKQLNGRVELIVGLLQDQQFGPCVMLGVGGVMSEVINDTVFAMAPLTKTEAREMIGRLRSQKLLNGFRGSPPVDRGELASILISVGRLGIDYPRIKEVDINPLILTQEGLKAVDATIIVADKSNLDSKS